MVRNVMARNKRTTSYRKTAVQQTQPNSRDNKPSIYRKFNDSMN